MAAAEQKRGRAPVLVTAVVLLAIGLAGWQGWRWQAELRCDRIEVTGHRHAQRAELLKLARVAVGQRLYSMDPALVADRLRRHPWVQAATATRHPTGTLAIEVEERRPVALAVDAAGRPSFYLDRHGFMMPVDTVAAYDVPLLRADGSTYHPVQTIQNEQVRSVLETLAEASPDVEPLISEVIVEGSDEVWLRTTPAPEHGALRVRLGSDELAAKLKRLRAFWQQAVLPRPDTRYELIDLRFDNQIVTRESTS